MLQRKSVVFVGCLMAMVVFTAASLYAVELPVPTKFNEAPMLRTRVAAGLLPPVEERLPVEPKVVGTGVELPKEDLDYEIGQYGGTLRMVFANMFGGGSYWCVNRDQLLTSLGMGTTAEKPEGRIFKGYEASSDAKTFTFFLRKGLKWSDGVPVTTEDVRFWYEDVINNKELTPVYPKWLLSDGKPMELEVIDDYTFRFSFADSYGVLPWQLCEHWKAYYQTGLLPSHYLKRFHPRYTSMEELKPLIKAAGYEEKEWAPYFLIHVGDRGVVKGLIGVPTLTPWMLVEKPSPTVSIVERNPYYWKVDTEGNQLPYIDRIRLERVSSVEMIKMKILAGEVDFSEDVTTADVSLYKEGEKKGGYRTVLFTCCSQLSVLINQSYSDRVWREIAQDVRFRRALNFAIDRKPIIDNIYCGLAAPSRIVDSEYNPAKANQLLDEMGLNECDAEGWRLRPDGKRLELLVETSAAWDDQIPMTELLVRYWRDIGVWTEMKVQGQILLRERYPGNLTQIRVDWYSVRTSCSYNPARWVGGKLGEATWGALFADWYASEGKKGEEPPAEIMKLYELGDRIRKSVSVEEIHELLDETMRWIHDKVLVITPVEDNMIPLIVAKNLGNVASSGYRIMAQWGGECLFFRQK